MPSQYEQVELERLRKKISDTAGSAEWGSITGTLSNQTDLQTSLNDKQNILSEGQFVNGDKTKLDGIATGAEVNPDVVSQAEAEAGTATTERIWTAERVKQAIDALGGGGGGGSGVGGWQVIEVIDASAASSVDFTGISADYVSLKLQVEAAHSSTGIDNAVRFNNDSGANYQRAIDYNNGSTASALFTNSQNEIDVWITGPDPTVWEFLIANYANTSRDKIMVGMTGLSMTNLSARHQVGKWNSTAAINRITITPNSGTLTGKFILMGLVPSPALLDEDDMATDSASQGATQQSIKAFVENQSPIHKSMTEFRGGLSSGTSIGTRWYGVQWPDGTSSNRMSTTVYVPDGWNTVDITVHWSTPATSGNMYLGVQLGGYGVGDDPDATPAYSANTAMACHGTTDYMQYTTISGVSVVGGEIHLLSLIRLGADALDTLSAAVDMFGITLTRAS